MLNAQMEFKYIEVKEDHRAWELRILIEHARISAARSYSYQNQFNPGHSGFWARRCFHWCLLVDKKKAEIKLERR